jgi:hypothetical protein
MTETLKPEATAKAALTHEDLRSFSGDIERYTHPFCRQVIYSPGMRYLAEAGQAYWLLDEIAFTLGSPSTMRRLIAKDARAAEMLFWRLRVRDDKTAVLIGEVDQGQTVTRRAYTYTDFPLDRVEIWTAFDGTRWTIYLPSEH